MAMPIADITGEKFGMLTAVPDDYEYLSEEALCRYEENTGKDDAEIHRNERPAASGRTGQRGDDDAGTDER